MVTPEANFNGQLNVRVTINDGHDNSEVYLISVDIQAVEDPLSILGTHQPVASADGDPVVLNLADLVVLDDHSEFPNGFVLVIFKGDNYTVDGNTIIPDEDFSGTLTVLIQVSNGKNSSNVYRLEVKVEPVTGIGETSSGGVEIYPNPNRGKFKFTLPDGDHATVRILDAIGGVVHQEDVADTFERELDLAVTAGMYYLEITSGSSRTVCKFIVY